MQLVKDAFGLVTQAERRGRAPVLVYLFAESQRATATADKLASHCAEIARFAGALAGAAVAFHALS